MSGVAFFTTSNDCRDADCSQINCEDAILKQFEQFDFHNKSQKFRICVFSIQAVQCPKRWKVLDNLFSGKTYPLEIIFCKLDQIELKDLFNSSLVNLISQAKDLSVFACQKEKESLDYFKTIFEIVQSSQKLRNLNLSFSLNSSLLPVKFEPIQGSLINLESLSINTSTSKNYTSLCRSFAEAMTDPNKPQGYLKYFRFEILFNEIRQKHFDIISRILNFNKNSLEKIKIFYSNSNFTYCHLHYYDDKFLIYQQNLNQRDANRITETERQGFQIKRCFNMFAERSTELNTKRTSIRIQLRDVRYESLLQINQFLGNFQRVCLDFVFSKDSATVIGKTLGQSKNLQKLHLRTRGECLNEVLENSLQTSTSLTELKIDFLFDNQILEFKSNSLILKLELNLIFCENSSTLVHLFKEVTAMDNLKILSMHLVLSKEQIDLEKVIRPLSNLKCLQQLSLNIHGQSKSNFSEELQRRIALRLILHPSYPQVEITGIANSIQPLLDEYNLKVKIEVITLIGFNKFLSPQLLFHPRSHIEDLYF